MAYDRRLEALRKTPVEKLAPADFEITASQYAIKFRKTTRTHVAFTHASVPNCPAIPMGGAKIYPAHVRAFITMIEKMDEARTNKRWSTVEKAVPDDYRTMTEPHPAEEGGGFLVSYPDIPGCIGIGATEAEALEDARKACIAVLDALRGVDRYPPKPTPAPAS